MSITSVLSRCACTALVCLWWNTACAEQTLVVYTSLKESMIGQLHRAFIDKYPEIRMQYRSAGAGSLMARIAAERAAGGVQADILWTADIPDFYRLKAQGLLQPYVPAEIRAVLQPLPDYDGSFTAARLATVGIAYNTRSVKDAPTAWSDLKKPAFAGALAIADPTLSGTSFMSVAVLSTHFGWTFFEDLRANGTKMGQGSSQVIDDTAAGNLAASLTADYVALDKIDNGAPIALAYPPELILIPSPIAIFKGSPNLKAAKAFVDFVLSREGQTIIANEGTLPVRPDVTVPARYNLPPVAEALRRAMKIDYRQMIADKDETLRRFGEIMRR
ncbi:MAG: ABC transporter substrate-binding protein [Bacteroidota bacterium]